MAAAAIFRKVQGTGVSLALVLNGQGRLSSCLGAQVSDDIHAVADVAVAPNIQRKLHIPRKSWHAFTCLGPTLGRPEFVQCLERLLRRVASHRQKTGNSNSKTCQRPPVVTPSRPCQPWSAPEASAVLQECSQTLFVWALAGSAAMLQRAIEP